MAVINTVELPDLYVGINIRTSELSSIGEAVGKGSFVSMEENQASRSPLFRTKVPIVPSFACNDDKNMFLKVNDAFSTTVNTYERSMVRDFPSYYPDGSREMKIFGVSEKEPTTVISVYLSPTEKTGVLYELEMIDKVEKEIVASIKISHGTSICIQGPNLQRLERKWKRVGEEDKSELVELILREDKLRCSSFSLTRRIMVETLPICLERYKAELLFGTMTKGKQNRSYLDIIRLFWAEIKPVCQSSARVEFGCWCVDEPNFPAKNATSAHCHTQIILEVIREHEKEDIPDNIFIVNVKKANLDKRQIAAVEWVASTSNFYLGYSMPFLPFPTHDLKNVYKVASPPKVAKRKITGKVPPTKRQKK